MLRSIAQLYGDKLGASDGEIGRVKDFYFDDQDWVIRYIVADTGTWLSGRQVLVSPHSVERLDQAEKLLRVSLTRKQIEDSPSIESHKPVSRQYEEEFHRHFGWPFYWQGEALWGVSAFPMSNLPIKPVADLPGTTRTPRPDAHLRSAQAVKGYLVKSGAEMIGHISDFMMDAGDWAIGQLVVKTGHRISGKDVLVDIKMVERISYEESTVFIKLAGEASENGGVPQHASNAVAG